LTFPPSKYSRLSKRQTGAFWCKMLYNRTMKSQDKSVRQSVSLPSGIARRVRILAEKRKASANRVLVDLIEAGLHSREAEKERFFALTNQLAQSADPAERRRIKKELARMTFGDS
jgi:ribosomal protein L1